MFVHARPSVSKKKIREILRRSYARRLKPNAILIRIADMHNILKCLLVTVMCLANNPVWGSGDQWRMSPSQAETSAYQTSVIPMADGSPMPPPSVRMLAPDTERPRTQGILATTTWLKGAFSTETEVAANQGSPRGGDPSARMMRLGVIGSKGLARYGMTYRTEDPDFYQGSLYPQKAKHQLEAAVGYGGVLWDTKLASSYGYETDLLNHGAESQVQTQTVTASFSPADSLRITPTLGYRAEQQEWSGARIGAPSASIAMNYKQSSRLSVTAMGNYSAVRSSDKLVELDMIGGKGIVSWELEPLRDWKPQVSLEGGYNLQVNRLMPSGQTENISGLLRLVLATM